jgi:5-methylcytosine-specific restriction protein A
MTLQESFDRINSEFPVVLAEEQPFKAHPLADLIRHDVPEFLRQAIAGADAYDIAGSPGQGRWAFSPWIAIMDVLITTTVQRGYYPVFLFREDFKGLYLSLNQGVTDIQKKYKADAKKVLQVRAADYRAQLGGLLKEFPLDKIDLQPTDSQNLSAFL